jgi:glycerol kinase
VAGAAIQWLRDELHVINSAKESETIAMNTPDTAGAYVVPAFTGLGAPYWDQYARGAIVGLTRGFSRDHLVRATLESLAYQVYDILKAMEKDAKAPLSGLRVDGGACANNFLMQFQSDLIGSDVVRPRCIETTALGAAYLAGLAVKYWDSLDDVKSNWEIDRVFTSELEEEKRVKLLNGWHKAVKCALLWSEED